MTDRLTTVGSRGNWGDLIKRLEANRPPKPAQTEVSEENTGDRLDILDRFYNLRPLYKMPIYLAAFALGSAVVALANRLPAPPREEYVPFNQFGIYTSDSCDSNNKPSLRLRVQDPSRFPLGLNVEITEDNIFGNKIVRSVVISQLVEDQSVELKSYSSLSKIVQLKSDGRSLLREHQAERVCP